MTIGRNDPCPCGSGKKYKHCCLAKHDLAEARWLAWRQAEGVVVPAVADFAAETWGEAILEDAAQTFFVEAEPSAGEDTPEAWEQLRTGTSPSCPASGPIRCCRPTTMSSSTSARTS